MPFPILPGAAGAANPGLVSTSAQTLVGVKTFSNGAVLGAGRTVTKIDRLTVTLDVPSIAANSATEVTFAGIEGAASLEVGDAIIVNREGNPAGLGISNAYVSATNTIRIQFVNATASAIDPAAMNFRIIVIRA